MADLNVGDVFEWDLDGKTQRYRVVVRYKFHSMNDQWVDSFGDWASQYSRRRTLYNPWSSRSGLGLSLKTVKHLPLTDEEQQQHHPYLQTFLARSRSWSWGDSRGLPYDEFRSALVFANLEFDPDEPFNVDRIAVSTRGHSGGWSTGVKYFEPQNASGFTVGEVFWRTNEYQDTFVRRNQEHRVAGCGIYRGGQTRKGPWFYAGHYYDEAGIIVGYELADKVVAIANGLPTHRLARELDTPMEARDLLHRHAVEHVYWDRSVTLNRIEGETHGGFYVLAECPTWRLLLDEPETTSALMLKERGATEWSAHNTSSTPIEAFLRGYPEIDQQ